MTKTGAITQYKTLLGLCGWEFFQIDHEDAIIADVYKVSHPSKPTLILKKCASESEYYRELFFLRHLQSSLPVPRLIDSVAPSSNTAGAILMEYLEGHLLHPNDWSEGLFYELGTVLARLHLNRTDAYGDLTKPEKMQSTAASYFEEKFSEELQECGAHLPNSLITMCERYFSAHRDLFDHVDGPCMIHRDFRPGNIMIRNGKIGGVIDWAGARSGFAEQDFCGMEHPQWPKDAVYKNAFLKGYGNIRPIPDSERIIPLLQIGRALAVIGFCVKSNTWQGKNRKIYEYSRAFLEHFHPI
jgi:Ser/Thr protein kinase RdoA (MazF antagonist)